MHYSILRRYPLCFQDNLTITTGSFMLILVVHRWILYRWNIFMGDLLWHMQLRSEIWYHRDCTDHCVWLFNMFVYAMVVLSMIHTVLCRWSHTCDLSLEWTCPSRRKLMKCIHLSSIHITQCYDLVGKIAS
jgi:hypothetical protein